MKGKTLSLIQGTTAIVVAAIAFSPAAKAQDIYDDIYYNPSRSATTTVQTVTSTPSTANYSGTPRDIDEYNRRGIFATSPVATADSLGVAEFANTQRIQRFYNNDIISASNDTTLQDLYYYTVDQPSTINIIVAQPSWSTYWGWCYPYYTPSWYYGWGSPSWYWNSWAWGPSWSWGWGPTWAWSPSWSWGWGPSWGWSWGWNHGWGGPGHGPGHGPGWGGGRPYNPRHPGAMASGQPHPGGSPGIGGGNPNGGGRPGVNEGPGNSGNSFGSQPSGRPSGGANQGNVNRPEGNHGGRPGAGTNIGNQRPEGGNGGGMNPQRPTGGRPGVSGNHTGISHGNQGINTTARPTQNFGPTTRPGNVNNYRPANTQPSNSRPSAQPSQPTSRPSAQPSRPANNSQPRYNTTPSNNRNTYSSPSNSSPSRGGGGFSGGGGGRSGGGGGHSGGGGGGRGRH